MQVILRDDLDNLGKSGEVVNVKPGYARNYLLPRGLARQGDRGRHQARRAREARDRGAHRQAGQGRRRPRPTSCRRCRSRSRAPSAKKTSSTARSPAATSPRRCTRRASPSTRRRSTSPSRSRRSADFEVAGQARSRRERDDQGLGRQKRSVADRIARRRSDARHRRTQSRAMSVLEVVSSNPVRGGADAAAQPRSREVGARVGVHQAGRVRRGRHQPGHVDDFFLPAHREIFEAMLAIDKRRQALDVIAVADELKTHGMLRAPRRRRRATSTTWPTRCRPRRTSLHYARLVREKATLRRLIAACAEVQSSAYGDFGEFETFLDEAETKVFKVAQQNRRETYSATGDLMEEVLHNLEVRTAERRAVTGVPTGFTKLDEIHGRPAAREPDHRRGAPRRRQDVVGGQRRDARGAAAQDPGAAVLAGDVEVRADGAHARRRGAHRLVAHQARLPRVRRLEEQDPPGVGTAGGGADPDRRLVGDLDHGDPRQGAPLPRRPALLPARRRP